MAIVFTQAQLDALLEAWATGALEVSVGDKKMRFDSREELEARIKRIESYLSAEPTESSNVIIPSYNKGEG